MIGWKYVRMSVCLVAVMVVGIRVFIFLFFVFCFACFFDFLIFSFAMRAVCFACCCRCLRSMAEPEMNSECASLNLAVRVCCFAVDIGAIICFRWYRCMLGHVMVVFRGVL